MYSLCFLKLCLFASTLFGAEISTPIVLDDDPPIPIIITEEIPKPLRPRSLFVEMVSANYSQDMLYVSIANYSGLVIVTVEDNLGNVVAETQQIISKTTQILVSLDAVAPGDYTVRIRTGSVYWGQISL